jgi:cytoskeletal protein CcmA (bactofilin family)
MGIKENFSQAVKEITGGKSDEKRLSEQKQSQVNEMRRAVEADTLPEEVSAPYYPDDQNTEYSQPSLTPSYATYQGYPQADRQTQPDEEPEEVTIISRNTVIEGNIRSFSNMEIDGNVRGDVQTTKNVTVNGKLVGNLVCNDATLNNSQLQGNLNLKGTVVMQRDTMLIGDVTSNFADINGKVKGNIQVAGKAELRSDAVIFGDISASTITISDGAVIQGYVTTTFLNNDESKNIFPESITIGE